MRKLSKMLLALAFALSVLFTSVSAVNNTGGQTLYTDEVGDYYLYEDGTVKAYVRLNQDAVYARFEGCWLRISDLDGNELILSSYWFDYSEHPWLEDIIHEYIRLNTTEDSTPPVAPPEFWNDRTYWETPVDDSFDTDISFEMPTVSYDNTSDRPTSSYGTPESMIASAADSSNPSTGLLPAILPMIAAAALAVLSKKN